MSKKLGDLYVCTEAVVTVEPIIKDGHTVERVVVQLDPRWRIAQEVLNQRIAAGLPLPARNGQPIIIEPPLSAEAAEALMDEISKLTGKKFFLMPEAEAAPPPPHTPVN